VKPAKATKRTSQSVAHSRPTSAGSVQADSQKTHAEVGQVAGDLRAQETSLQREEQLQLILDAADVGTWDWDIATGRVEWSENMERIHGQPSGSFGGTFDLFLQTVHPDDRAGLLAAVEKALRGGRYEIEYRQVGAGGQARWMGGRGRTICDESGRPVRMIGICADITARKQTEEQLKITRAELETRVAERTLEAAQLNEVLREKVRLLEIAHDGIIVRSIKGTILFWNQGAELTYGWRSEEALGEIIHTLLQTRFPKSLSDLEARLFEQGSWEGELTHTRRDGNEIVVSSRQVLQRNDKGQPVAMLEIDRDITEQKKADMAHRESEARLRALIEATDDAVFEFDEHGTYLNIWTTNEELLARPRRELLGRQLNEVLGTEVARPFLEAFERVSSTGRSEGIEYSMDFPGGTRWFLGKISRLSPVGDAGRVCLCVREITDRKQAEDELKHSAERFRLVVQAIKDYAIFMLDPEGHILTWNEGAERLKGYRPDEIIGRSFSVFYPPEDAAAGKPRRLLQAAIAEGRVEDEGWRVRKDGSRFWADVVITALRDEAGNLRGFAKVTRDMTERRKSEEAVRQLSGRLLRLQDEERRRMARELHDSTAQTLSALTLNLALVKQRAGSFFDAKASKSFEEALHLADQASREIRTFSYLLHPPMLDEAGLPYALRWYVDGFVDRTKIQVDLEASQDLGRLPSDVETALFRIVQECLTNIHRHSGSRTARIEVRREDHQVSLEVTDEGKGLPAGLFQEGNGRPAALGVGIRGMHERVRQLGGWIEVKNGQPGTIVKVALPLSEKTE